jgi:hypothetical protein
MNGSGLVCLEGHPLGYQATFHRYFSLTKHGGCAWWIYNTPVVVGPERENTEINLEEKESSAVWDSYKCTSPEVPCKAAEQDPVEQERPNKSW